jgi:hypothetical protein
MSLEDVLRKLSGPANFGIARNGSRFRGGRVADLRGFLRGSGLSKAGYD